MWRVRRMVARIMCPLYTDRPTFAVVCVSGPFATRHRARSVLVIIAAWWKSIIDAKHARRHRSSNRSNHCRVLGIDRETVVGCTYIRVTNWWKIWCEFARTQTNSVARKFQFAVLILCLSFTFSDVNYFQSLCASVSLLLQRDARFFTVYRTH